MLAKREERIESNSLWIRSSRKNDAQAPATALEKLLEDRSEAYCLNRAGAIFGDGILVRHLILKRPPSLPLS